MKPKPISQEEIKSAVFKRGDIVVSESREFRLIVNLVRWNSSCLAYEWYPLQDSQIKSASGNVIKTEKLERCTQPTDIVERHFHLYELK